MHDHYKTNIWHFDIWQDNIRIKKLYLYPLPKFVQSSHFDNIKIEATELENTSLQQTFYTGSASLISFHLLDFFFKIDQMLFYFWKHLLDLLGVVWFGEGVAAVVGLQRISSEFSKLSNAWKWIYVPGLLCYLNRFPPKFSFRQGIETDRRITF